jgi:outer membrane receptor protein involved in Fe transport
MLNRHPLGDYAIARRQNSIAAYALVLSFALCTCNDPQAQAPDTLEEIRVLGSRIPIDRAFEPTPITTLDRVELDAAGLTSTPEVLRAIAQNSGETQSQQSFSGSSFTPGAQQVDLRGLGPNHTLVLVNGRRIADFPLPFQGRSNFTDISGIPFGLIERVEVLSGSASAIYGSDAIAGVVNFVLKEHADETSLDYRYGSTEHGGGSSHHLTLTSGLSGDAFDLVYGLDYVQQQPLWAFDRSIQDSTADNPTSSTPIAQRNFLREDPRLDAYVDPGAALCGRVAFLNDQSTYYASRPNRGPNGDAGRYCGSDASIGYGTILSGRRALSTHASLSYRLNPQHSVFAMLDIGRSDIRIFRDVLDWQYQDNSGSEDGIFFNPRSGGLDSWYRQFAPEEFGGLDRSMIRNDARTFSIAPGARGKFGESGWTYELSFNHSEYRARVSWPQIVAARANELYLGPPLGTDDATGYTIFDADPDRLYAPLSPAEYDTIAAKSVYEPRSKYDGLAFTTSTSNLVELPAGPIGAALVAEIDAQQYQINPDPLALTHYYYALKDSDGGGQRHHQGAGIEFRVPLLARLQLSHADRYDRYSFAGTQIHKSTYQFGIEWRPLDALLIRSSFGTGFRAPDLHYVFAGEGNTHPSATDYYLCRSREPQTDLGECSFADNTIVESHAGNRDLRPETSTSFSSGVVWSPNEAMSVSVDYFRIQLNNEVQDLDRDALLRTEADCRLRRTTTGAPIDADSATCLDAFERVRRNSADDAIGPEELIGVRVNPVNVATERTSGVDLSVRSRWTTALGELALDGMLTYVAAHSLQRRPGERRIDTFELGHGYDNPRSKANLTLRWSRDRWAAGLHAQRLDRLPNYAETDHIDATYLYNGTFNIQCFKRARVGIAVDNLLDSRPAKDRTYASYPYYDISWFDAAGRTFYLGVNVSL